MVALNIISIDLAPYCIRAIFQSREMQISDLALSSLLLSLMIYDYCEIWQKGSRGVVQEIDDESLQKYYKKDCPNTTARSNILSSAPSESKGDTPAESGARVVDHTATIKRLG